MRAVTHISFGLLSLGVLSSLLHCPLNLSNIIAAGASSLLPDIDTNQSTLGKIFQPISKYLDENYGHRTLTHSWLGLGALAILCIPFYFWTPSIYFAILIGFISHLIIDCFNKTGIPFFWPSEVYFVLPGNPRWRIEVGSKAETILCIILFILCAVVWNVQSIGFRSLMSSFFATPSEAIKEYKKHTNNYSLNLEISGFHNLTQQAITKKTYPIIDILGNKSFLLKTPEGHLISAGEGSEDIIHLDKAIVRKEKPATVKTKIFRFGGQDLSLMFPKLNENSYLSGSLEAHTRPRYVKEDLYHFRTNEFQTIKLSSGIGEFSTMLELNNATLKQIKSLGNINVSGEVVVREVE
jgi:inner membrane protein